MDATDPVLDDVGSTFAYVQRQLVQFIRDFNAVGFGNVPNLPIFPEVGDDDAHAIEAAGRSVADLADERADYALAVFGDPWDVGAVIESAAVAAELFQSDVSYERLTAWLDRPVPPQRSVYRSCLQRALPAIATRDIDSFLLSYMTICELALFAPLLPHHAALRQRHGCRLSQLLPARRFSALLSAACTVTPMQDRADHARYRQGLQARLSGVPQEAIVRASLDDPEFVRNPMAFLYQAAQRWRRQESTGFIGIDSLLFTPDPGATLWRSRFDFVIVDYADRTTYHRDKGFLRSMTTRYLETLGLQTIMRGRSLALPTPYGQDANETEWMTEYLRGRFATLFPAGDFSALRFVPAPARPPQQAASA